MDLAWGWFREGATWIFELYLIHRVWNLGFQSTNKIRKVSVKFYNRSSRIKCELYPHYHPSNLFPYQVVPTKLNPPRPLKSAPRNEMINNNSNVRNFQDFALRRGKSQGLTELIVASHPEGLGRGGGGIHLSFPSDTDPPQWTSVWLKANLHDRIRKFVRVCAGYGCLDGRSPACPSCSCFLRGINAKG